MATGREGGVSRAAQEGAELPVGLLTDGGEVLSSGGVGDRGGQDAIEDGDGNSGQYSPGRVRPRVLGGQGRLGVDGIGERGLHCGEFGRRPSGGGELVVGAPVLPRG